MIRFAGMFLVLALSVVGAETYTLEIYQPVLLGGKQLKSGEYKLDVQGGNITLKKGKLLAAESKVKVETLGQKAPATRLICDKVGDNLQVSAIELKGSTTKLVME
jgi:hypothetical protein